MGKLGSPSFNYEQQGNGDPNFEAPIMDTATSQQVMWTKEASFCADDRTIILFTQQAPTKCTVLFDLSDRETTCQSYAEDSVDEPKLLTIDQCLWHQQYQSDGTWSSNSKKLTDDHGILKYEEYFNSYTCGGAQVTQMIGCGKADGQCHTAVVRTADNLRSSVLITDPNSCAPTTQDPVTCFSSDPNSPSTPETPSTPSATCPGEDQIDVLACDNCDSDCANSCNSNPTNCDEAKAAVNGCLSTCAQCVKAATLQLFGASCTMPGVNGSSAQYISVMLAMALTFAALI